MAVTALLISAIALLISGVSLVYVRRQSVLQAEATAIERDRRQAERAPDFEVEIEDVNNDFRYFRLWLRVASDESLDAVAVELPEDSALRFATNILGVTDPRHAHSYEGAIAPSERLGWRIEVPDNVQEQEALLVRSRSGKAHWTKRVMVEVPPTNLGIF